MVFFELARRGLSHPHTVAFVKRTVATASESPAEPLDDLPIWGQIVVTLTFAVVSVGFFLLSYMLDHVLTTLCMVETPSTAITVRVPVHDEVAKKNGEDETLLETNPSIAVVSHKPITSSIRGTTRHLVSIGGRAARFRGLRLYMIYSFAVSMSASILSIALTPVPAGSIFSLVLASILCIRLHAAWTHTVISMPTDKTIRQRVPDRSAFRSLIFPTILKTIMPYVAFGLIVVIVLALGFFDIEDAKLNRGAFGPTYPLRVAFVVLFAIFCVLFLCIPAVVTLVRLEASLLPEDDDTIVPFDRTFGGKVLPALALGSEGASKLSFLDAWRSFNWEARRRLLKLYVKIFAVTIALALFVAHVVLLELYLILGKDLGRFLVQYRKF